MDFFAFFLPQFHEIKENNEWWGEGFTEWTNVRKAHKLYANHKQPKQPLNNNYYNLLDKKTVIWQTNLMNSYGITGMIYYHYYFKGKLLLEKPAENLLQWKELDQPFFFCWANHQWKKTWQGSSEILVPMEYGEESDWEEHLKYLLPFFKDERYVKKDNKPLFMLFISKFNEREAMLDYFDYRLKQEGFDGISIIESRNEGMSQERLFQTATKQTEYVFLREPTVQLLNYQNSLNPITKFAKRIHTALSNRRIINRPLIYKGESLIKSKIKNEIIGEKIIHGIWFEWDNTPRHEGRGYVITPYSKENFMRYMDLIKDEKYVIINAWNEWCEGMILEPTQDEKYKYLEWIKEWKDKQE